jgi:hypothetical protein
MEAAGSSETFAVVYHTICRHISEYSELNLRFIAETFQIVRKSIFLILVCVCLCLRVPVVARQQLGKHIPAATNTHGPCRIKYSVCSEMQVGD